ncbi:MAG: Smr/MutS family protein, partial [Anaerolineae bacterium]|nr:Smr/MutS family protein [Anaerolineae bacterium]
MNAKSLRVLEFGKVLHLLAEYTAFSAGRELALALTPTGDFDEVARRQRETSEAKDWIARKGDVSLGGARDIRGHVRHAQIGAVLQPSELLEVSDTLRAARYLRKDIERLEVKLPLLYGITRRMSELPDLSQAITQAINDAAEVVDSASPDLARIRRELSIARAQVMERINRILNSEARKYLQEALVTERDGRFVVPIKADFKGRIPGLVHDVSASGATLFVEPLAVVEAGNRVRQLLSEEQREIERILRELSGLVADRADALNETVMAMAELDLALAKGRYSFAIKAIAPELMRVRTRSFEDKRKAARKPKSDEEPTETPPKEPEYPLVNAPRFKFVRARHPLLDPTKVVPIDIYNGEDFRILLITGPNTGGKTVALKTVGLLTVMTQAGLHIPAAEGSLITPFSGVYADIGDEQSIEQSLSTFSSHMSNIIEILRQSDARSLVLLDELGAGTDPVEGSALARAILETLLERRVTVVGTTHYSELKAFAYGTPGVVNSSVEFDINTLSPTYELTIGLPGRSNAFAIAERLGLSFAILERARKWLTEADVAMEDMLGDIKTAREATFAARADAEKRQREITEAETALKKRLAEAERERVEILNRARQEAEAELNRVREELKELRNELRRARKELATPTQVNALMDRVEQLADDVVPETPPPAFGAPRLEELVLGSQVRVASLNAMGEVISLNGAQAEVQVGALRVRVPVTSLEPLVPTAAPRARYEQDIRVTPANDLSAVGVELDLRGERAEDALRRVEDYLDDAYLAGLARVRIIHGKGTGALRKATRELLSSHPLV